MSTFLRVASFHVELDLIQPNSNPSAESGTAPKNPYKSASL